MQPAMKHDPSSWLYTAAKQRRAEAVVDCRRGVVIKTHAVSAPAVGAIATGGVGALVEIQSGKVKAPEHSGVALSGQRGRGVARTVLEGGQHAVVACVRLHASHQHWRAAAVIEGSGRVEGVKAAVHAAALDALAIIHHGKDLVVLGRAGGAAVGRGRRGRRRRGWRRTGRRWRRAWRRRARRRRARRQRTRRRWWRARRRRARRQRTRR
eukprot:scaffold66150_cov57-Phaeocystis_antarctica.AAC.2